MFMWSLVHGSSMYFQLILYLSILLCKLCCKGQMWDGLCSLGLVIMIKILFFKNNEDIADTCMYHIPVLSAGCTYHSSVS